MSGPLGGIRIVELAGIGPAPFAGMVLADMGADVVRVARPGAGGSAPTDVLNRGKRSVAVDLKSDSGRDLVLSLCGRADALIEGFRPGVTEKLGVGPDACRARNGKLVYARMTGWGQDGPFAGWAGHDINYIALSGALSMFGRADVKPVPPVNLVGDFGGGGMLVAFGILCALLEARESGEGQVIDAAMVDGAALLSSMIWGLKGSGLWSNRGTNLLDTGAWFYEVYETSDGRYISVGALEPQFLAELLDLTGLAEDVDGGGPVPRQLDRDSWPAMKARLAALFKTRTRDEWCSLLEETDTCFAPVLDMDEVASHPHNSQRQTFIEVGGVTQPAPAPRFSRTKARVDSPPPAATEDISAVLSAWGLSGP